MMTEQEQERLRMVHASIDQVSEQLDDIFGEDVLPEGFKEVVLGTMLAAVDAMFAIRDEQSWRDKRDPREIARLLLREAHLGEA